MISYSIKTFSFLITLHLIFAAALCAQQNQFGNVLDSTVIYQEHQKTASSLQNESYDEIRKVLQKFKNQPKLHNIYANAYIQKAKASNDTIEIANGYDLMFKYNLSNYEVATRYVDSIIEITKNIKHKYYPSRGYLNKGILLYNDSKYNEALEYYLKAESHAKENNNISHQIAIKHNIGRLKNVLNRHNEALVIYKSNLEFLKFNNIENEQKIIYLGTLYGLSDSYNKLGKIDSADFFIRKGIEESLNSDNAYFYLDFLLEYGINNTFRENHQNALDTLYKLEKLLFKSDVEVNKLICYTYLGKNLYKLGERKKAMVYLEKVDAAITPSNYVPDVREAFEILIYHYKNKSNHKNQLKFLEKLIVLDSVANKKNKDLNINIIKNYDTKLLVKDRDLLIKNLNSQKSVFEKSTYILILVLFGSILLFFLWYFKRSKSRQGDVSLLRGTKGEIIKNHDSTNKSKKNLEIPEFLVREISLKIKAFENKNKFLANNINLVSLAKELNTNSTYLSHIINNTAGKNFANYINDLRIDYAIKKLKKEPKFRRYSIAAIAEEVGFNNIKSFSRAFLKKTGEHPSEYIKKLS